MRYDMCVNFMANRKKSKTDVVGILNKIPKTSFEYDTDKAYDEMMKERTRKSRLKN